jgi:hypothetical protein
MPSDIFGTEVIEEDQTTASGTGIHAARSSRT